MILLRTLGKPRLEGATTSMVGRRRELTLAAFIAVRAPRACQRAELASLLWEDRDESRARQSLRQALLELKRVLGEAIRIDGDQVTMDPTLVRIDVAELTTALDQGREADAVALWHGDFLAGMDEVGGEAYRSWLETEREALRRRMRIAFARLAEPAVAGRDWALARQRAEQWATAFPLDEAAERTLIEVLARSGNTTGALARCQAFIARLKADLDLPPSVELLQLRDRISRESPGGRAPGSAALFSPDLVGRAPMLAELMLAWREAQTGTPSFVMVEGEPGLGKTRLLEELSRLVVEGQEPALVLGTAQPTGDPSVELADARALFIGLAEAPGVAGATPGALGAIGTLVPALAERYSGPPVSAPLHQALADLLAAVADEQPVLLLLDDTHLMDPASQQLLGHLVPRLRGRILLVAIGRDDGKTSSPVVAALRSTSRFRRLKLQALSVADVERMLASMLELGAADCSRLARRLEAEGGGNPLYVIEMTSALVDEGQLRNTPEVGWRYSHTDDRPLPVPDSLRAATVRRLQGLGTEARRVAEAAAVLGPRFPRGALAATAGMEPAELDRGLDALLASRLIREAPDERDSLEFRHHLTARIVYDELPPARRAALHASAARSYAHQAGNPASAAMARYHRSRTRPVRRWMMWGAAALALVAGLVVWLRRPVAAPSESRVVVAAFENQTGDTALNAAGQFMADWITQGIAQSEVVPVVDVRTALTSGRIVDADTSKRGIGRLRALAADVGAGRVVWGTLYRRNDSLVVQTNITDATSGQMIRALEPVSMASHDPSGAVDQVSQNVLGALALLYNSRNTQVLKEVKHPPSYRAYQAFMTGMDLLVQYRSPEAAAQFARAHVLDSTFTQALMWESDAYEQVNRWSESDSVLRLAARSRDRLGRYEQLFLDYRRHDLAGEFGLALDKARELSRIAPGSEATFMVGTMALRLFRPNEALRALAEVDPDRGFLKGWDGYWGYPMQAHMMLDQLDLALADAREGRRRYPDSRQAIHQEVTVLSAMGNEAEVNRLLDIEDGLPESPGLPLPRTIRGAATIFRAYGFDSAAHRMAERAVSLLPNKDTSAAGDENRLILVEALYLLERYADARPIVSVMERRAPDDMTWRGYSGLLSARLGDRSAADSVMRRLAEDRRPFAFGRGALWRARIEAALGQEQQAIALLRTGLAQGLAYDQAFISAVPDFRGFSKHAEFRELFRPRG